MLHYLYFIHMNSGTPSSFPCVLVVLGKVIAI